MKKNKNSLLRILIFNIKERVFRKMIKYMIYYHKVNYFKNETKR